MEKAVLLKQYFGHSEFRPGQGSLIDALLSGRDVLGVMPTGAGKSVCYQLPAMMLPGVALVISPLISLMKDQVAALSQAGIAAAYINSSLSPREYHEVLRGAQDGAYKIIYVAPERLTSADFLRFSAKAEISLVAVDEAHCVSQWGQDFRPSYLKIAEFIAALPERPVVGAFTATATTEVKTDIERLLALREPLRLTTGFDRPNLYFEVIHSGKKDVWLHQFLNERVGQSGIIYCATRKTVESVCSSLQKSGISATRYHAGLDDGERRKNQEDFIYDRSGVMVATNAFGMGIDKSNVSFVVHYNMPKNLESYYQEVGRAGRDGGQAHCVLLFSPGDVMTAKYLIEHAAENELLTDEEQEAVRRQERFRLEQMVSYCKTTGCLRNALLTYFGEASAANCGSCGNCTGEAVLRDITVEAQKILSAVLRVERKYPTGLGVTLIVRMLHGSKDQRVIQLGLDRLSTYAVMKDVSRMQIRDYIDYLLSEGYLRLTEGEFPVLRTTERARDVLFTGKKVRYPFKMIPARQAAKPSFEKAGSSPPANQDLYEILKELRSGLAQKASVPAYVVFSNAALTDMAAKQPQNMEEFLRVSGVGTIKAERYGDVFLKKIREWKEGNGV